MVRLSDLPDYEAAHLLEKCSPPLGPTPWVSPDRALGERRFALVTTAGVHRRGDEGFAINDATYRLLPAELDAGELVMSHSSVNFDRSGFFDDLNVVLPVDRFRELEADGTIAGLSGEHVSFMGAGLMPEAYERPARSLAKALLEGGTDTVFLTPV